MSMLKVIDLFVIDQIIGICSPRPKAQALSLYLNCLIHHFRGVKAKESNAGSFFIKMKDAQYEKFKHLYDELCFAGLISYTFDEIKFENKWSFFIDSKRYAEYSRITLDDPDLLKTRLLSNKQGIALIKARNGFGDVQILKLLDNFVAEQIALNSRYSCMEDMFKHFVNWCPKNKSILKTISHTSARLLGND